MGEVHGLGREHGLSEPREPLNERHGRPLFAEPLAAQPGQRLAPPHEDLRGIELAAPAPEERLGPRPEAIHLPAAFSLRIEQHARLAEYERRRVVDRVKGGLHRLVLHVAPRHGQGVARGSRLSVRQQPPVKGDGEPPRVLVAHGVAHGHDLRHARLEEGEGRSRVAARVFDRFFERGLLGRLGGGL